MIPVMNYFGRTFDQNKLDLALMRGFRVASGNIDASREQLIRLANVLDVLDVRLLGRLNWKEFTNG